MNDLLGKVWHYNGFLVLIVKEEFLYVPRRLSRSSSVVQATLLQVVGVHYRYDLGFLFHNLVLHIEGKQADEAHGESFHMVHVEDLFKSQEEHIRGVRISKAKVLRYPYRVKRVEWIWGV